jgi:hypothetical protein
MNKKLAPGLLNRDLKNRTHKEPQEPLVMAVAVGLMAFLSAVLICAVSMTKYNS